MNPEISEFLKDRIGAGDFPSAVYLVADKGRIAFEDALGYAVVDPEKIEARIDTIYDVASLTKVLATGPLAALMVQSGRLDLEEPVSTYDEAFEVPDKREITVKDLLIHTSGLESWVPLYLLRKGYQTSIDIIAKRPINYDRGTRVVYSDLNFMALRHVIENLSRMEFHEDVRDLIAAPLGLRDTGYRHDRRKARRRVAASEAGNHYEWQTCIDLGYVKPTDRMPKRKLRDRLIWGEVHDGNAACFSGVEGHAGLFSTVEDIFRIAMQFLPGYSKLFKPHICDLFRTNFTPKLNEHRSFAFQLASTPDSAAGLKMPPESFGHLGFTGTSLWIDPVNERIFILLTNRTHDHDLPFVNINSVRRRFHDLAIEALDRK